MGSTVAPKIERCIFSTQLFHLVLPPTQVPKVVPSLPTQLFHLLLPRLRAPAWRGARAICCCCRSNTPPRPAPGCMRRKGSIANPRVYRRGVVFDYALAFRVFVDEAHEHVHHVSRMASTVYVQPQWKPQTVPAINVTWNILTATCQCAWQSGDCGWHRHGATVTVPR